MIVNSQAGRRVLEAGGLAPGRIETVDNGIDLDRFAPDAADRERLRAEWEAGDRTVIGHVGRIDPMKDHATFLAALARLKARGAAFRAVVVAVGEESARARLREEGAALGLSPDDLLVMGQVGDPARLHRGFDLLCSSSAFGEGFSNVIAEALASGVPVVATDVGDAARIVGEAGLVVPPREPETLAAALADAIRRLPELRPLARPRAAPWSIPELARRTASVIGERMRRR